MRVRERTGPGEPFLLLGMVHLPPLPGSPRWERSIAAVLDRAVRDASVLAETGFDGVVVENFGDAPFLPGPVAPWTVAAMTLAATAVREAIGPNRLLGINVLRNDARAALGIAAAAGADLLRINVHTGSMWTDQGLLEGRAWETLRDRARLGAESVAILADVLVKHADPPVPADPARTARDAVDRGLADGVIVTGPATGEQAAMETLEAVRQAVDAPVFVGSGVTAGNLPSLGNVADGAIVGTAVKDGGTASAPVDPARARRLVAARPRRP